jgi:hypothetical protein
MYSRVQVLGAVLLLAAPGVTVDRVLAGTGHGWWTQLLGGLLTTWVCLLVLVRRQLAARLRGRDRLPSPDR